MITLGLENLRPGMILAEPVYNFQGVLLLDAGAKLTEKSIRIFKSWGVVRVSVEGKSEEKNSLDGRSDDKTMDEINKMLLLKFSDVLNDPVMEEIMRVAGKIIQKRSS